MNKNLLIETIITTAKEENKLNELYKKVIGTITPTFTYHDLTEETKEKIQNNLYEDYIFENHRFSFLDKQTREEIVIEYLVSYDNDVNFEILTEDLTEKELTEIENLKVYEYNKLLINHFDYYFEKLNYIDELNKYIDFKIDKCIKDNFIKYDILKFVQNPKALDNYLNRIFEIDYYEDYEKYLKSYTDILTADIKEELQEYTTEYIINNF